VLFLKHRQVNLEAEALVVSLGARRLGRSVGTRNVDPDLNAWAAATTATTAGFGGLVRYGLKAAFTDEGWRHFSGGA
jgi:hypothetical protein